jgi:hypothetical protein
MLFINGTCSTIAWASLSTRDRVPRAPARMPFRARLPASIQTKLSPRLCSWSSMLLLPALPIATTQINAATPTEIPRIVSTLRSQFRPRDKNASRKRALKFIARKSTDIYSNLDTRRFGQLFNDHIPSQKRTSQKRTDSQDLQDRRRKAVRECLSTGQPGLNEPRRNKRAFLTLLRLPVGEGQQRQDLTVPRPEHVPAREKTRRAKRVPSIGWQARRKALQAARCNQRQRSRSRKRSGSQVLQSRFGWNRCIRLTGLERGDGVSSPALFPQGAG